jgi:glycosyltransferase involved in cell wall biosynthesis
MRVACVVPGDIDTVSGGFGYDRRLVEALRAAGDDVSVHSVPWRRYPCGVVDAPRLSRPPNADVVVVDELAHPTFAGVAVEAWDVPVVALVHHLRCDEGGVAAPLARALERRFLSRVDAVVCTSSATARSVADLLSSPPPTLVAPPTDDQFQSETTPDDVDARATRDPFRVVLLGSLVPRKRPLALVDALAALDRGRTQEQEWRATFVGPHPDGAYADRVRRHCRRRGVADRVTLTGALPTDEVAAVLREAHVLALPSTHEGFGIAALEGMGFGLPAVVTFAGGATDLVTHDETGFLVPPEATGAVYTALSTLASDRSRLARMGRAALARARSWPSWSTTVEEVRTFLTQVVDDRRPPTAGGPHAG